MHNPILIDSHAHLHDFVSVSNFLSHACSNFRNCGRVPDEVRFIGFLCLADFTGANGWKRLKKELSSQSVNDWKLNQIDETTISAESENGDKIYLIAGKQVVSQEGLEVLALGVNTLIESGQPLDRLVKTIDKLGGLSVAPWGSGKWWGRRGRLIGEMIKSGKPTCYGDNGGRPWFWKSKLLKLATQKGLPVIPGSDPLPIKIDCLRNGSYGLKIKKALAEQVSAEWLFNILNTADYPKNKFGNNMAFWQYIYRQLLIRMK